MVGTALKTDGNIGNVVVQSRVSQSPQFLTVPMNTVNVVTATPTSAIATKRNVKFQDEL